MMRESRERERDWIGLDWVGLDVAESGEAEQRGSNEANEAKVGLEARRS